MRSIEVCGTDCNVLIDTENTRSIVHRSVCQEWSEHSLRVVTASGHDLWCIGTADVRVIIPGLDPVTISALVVRTRPLGFQMVLGMNGVQALGGVSVRSPSDVFFCGEKDACASSAS